MNINFDKYNLIGIGNFSHGDANIINYRLDLIAYLVRNTNKQITIYVEDTPEHTRNIMKHKRLSYYKKYGLYLDKWPYGPLSKYCNGGGNVNYLQFIKYIRKHKIRINTNKVGADRIRIIGVDNGKIDRDYDMARMILKTLNKTHINLWFASNDHVSTNKLALYNTKWMKNKTHKYHCGYYLRQKLKNKYCIILSSAYKGIISFRSACINDDCYERIFKDKPFEYTFKYNKNKQYNNDIPYILYNKNEFKGDIINYQDAYFCKMPHISIKKDYNHVLFLNNIKPPTLIT